MMDCDKVTPVTDCDCPIPDGGWCEPHQIRKNAHYVWLCQNRPAYRRVWNECRGPLQKMEDKPKHSRPTLGKGPGRELAQMLGCSDSKRCDFPQMNQWGVDGCRENINTIVGWIASPRIDSGAAIRMVNLAITRAEQKLEHTNGN